MLAGDWIKEYRGEDASPVTLKWVSLCATSLVVMGTASGLFIDVSCSETSDLEAFEAYCTRTNFAIYFSVGSAAISIAMIALRKAFTINLLIGLGMMIGWCFGVAYFTFGDGPGTTLGNIYFATWISFFLAMSITTTSFRYVRGKGDDNGKNEEGKIAAKPVSDGAAPDEEEVEK